MIGGVAAFALPAGWLDVYFNLGGEAVEVMPAQADRYAVTATIAAIALALAFVCSLTGGRALRWITGIALALGLAAILMFQVPSGRFWPAEPEPAPYDTDYRPCLGTSGHCPGG